MIGKKKITPDPGFSPLFSTTKEPAMLIKREDQESREENLAPYAQKVASTAGRRHPEPQHHLRTDYQRDRARIIHSRAFRRLEYKTQVFLNGTGDHLRTRLTHTMEVASVSRSIAVTLNLNADLTEAIALAHDLGHAPFGHAGEEALAECMADHGGFEHNLQSLRTVRFIERTYPDFDGLNLTYETLEGLQKHADGLNRPAFGTQPAESFPHPSLEAQVADLADEIAYYSHDIEDGISHRFITTAQLAEIPLWRECMEESKANHKGIDETDLVRLTVRNLIDREVEELTLHTHATLKHFATGSADMARRSSFPLAGYPQDLSTRNRQLRNFLYENLYRHPEIASTNALGRRRISEVFRYFLQHPDQMGNITRERVESETLERCVCDYVAGMTDRYLIEKHARIT